jgi:hypothetical protein
VHLFVHHDTSKTGMEEGGGGRRGKGREKRQNGGGPIAFFVLNNDGKMRLKLKEEMVVN